MPPPPDGFDYPRWIAESLRLVARRALEAVAAGGLPPGHQFLVSVRTGAEGVHLPAFLRREYPEEITLVLENQFWDLVVDDEGFSVTLAFAGSRHRVFAPWAGLSAFADPAAELALRFELAAAGHEEDPGGDRREAPAATPPETGAAPPAGELADEEEGDGGAGAGGEVVRIDRFRRRGDDD